MKYNKTTSQIEDDITDVLFAHMNNYICSDAAIGSLNYMALLYPDFSNMCYQGIDEINLGDSRSSAIRSTKLLFMVSHD